MFSRILKYIIPPFSFRVFFRRIFYSNLKKVPLEKPLLFVGNHQNSFMDGILVGSYLPQPLHFLMRADMLRKPFARFCLRELNVAPVYRIEEGLENVHTNLDTFTGIYNILKDNGNLVVFSEGICVQEKRLQKLRKASGPSVHSFRSNSDRIHSGLVEVAAAECRRRRRRLPRGVTPASGLMEAVITATHSSERPVQ